MLANIGIQPDAATTVFEDNQGCTGMTESDELSSRTKHIDLNYLILHNLHEQEIIDMKYCPTNTVVAAMVMKHLPKDRLRNLADAIQMKLK